MLRHPGWGVVLLARLPNPARRLPSSAAGLPSPLRSLPRAAWEPRGALGSLLDRLRGNTRSCPSPCRSPPSVSSWHHLPYKTNGSQGHVRQLSWLLEQGETLLQICPPPAPHGGLWEAGRAGEAGAGAALPPHLSITSGAGGAGEGLRAVRAPSVTGRQSSVPEMTQHGRHQGHRRGQWPSPNASRTPLRTFCFSSAAQDRKQLNDKRVKQQNTEIQPLVQKLVAHRIGSRAGDRTLPLLPRRPELLVRGTLPRGLSDSSCDAHPPDPGP